MRHGQINIRIDYLDTPGEDWHINGEPPDGTLTRIPVHQGKQRLNVCWIQLVEVQHGMQQGYLIVSGPVQFTVKPCPVCLYLEKLQTPDILGKDQLPPQRVGCLRTG